MSVWLHDSDFSAPLESSEGELLSVSVSVEPKLLEDLLEALAQLQFPINPQIYHDAALRYVYPDGREQIVPTTLVDFPAYATRLPDIKRLLAAYGFPPDAVQVTGMLDDIHGETAQESTPTPAPEHAAKVFRLKHLHACATH